MIKFDECFSDSACSFNRGCKFDLSVCLPGQMYLPTNNLSVRFKSLLSTTHARLIFWRLKLVLKSVFDHVLRTEVFPAGRPSWEFSIQTSRATKIQTQQNLINLTIFSNSFPSYTYGTVQLVSIESVNALRNNCTFRFALFLMLFLTHATIFRR